MAETATSPTGAEIRLIPPDELTELLGASAKRANARTVLVKLNDDRRAIVETLWRHGPFEDQQSGRATSKLEEALPSDLQRRKQLSAQLNSPLFNECIAREIRGKRCFRVELVAIPQEWVQSLNLNGVAVSEVEPEVEVVAEPEPIRPSQPTLFQHRDEVEAGLASAVAGALLAQVAEIISTSAGGAGALTRLRNDAADLERRLGGQVEYVDKLRRQLREAQDHNAALTVERDGLRSRLRAAEHNLAVATSADTAKIIDVEVKRQLATLMTKRPIGPATHGNDNAWASDQHQRHSH